MTQFFLTLTFGAVLCPGPGPGLWPTGAGHSRRTQPGGPGTASVCPDQPQHHPQCHPGSEDTRPSALCNLEFFQTISFVQTG